MDIVNGLYTLLEQKKQQMLDYEKVTLAVLEGDADAAEKYIIERDRLATEMAAVNEEMARLCDGFPDRQRVMDVVYARLPAQQVPSEYQPLYYLGQTVRSAYNRVMQTEEQVHEKLAAWRDEALEAIKQNQNMPKIKKYLTDLSESEQGGRLQNDKA